MVGDAMSVIPIGSGIVSGMTGGAVEAVEATGTVRVVIGNPPTLRKTRSATSETETANRPKRLREANASERMSL